MNDEQEIPFRLNVVYSRQSRYGGDSFSSCDAQYTICHDTATSLGLAVHDHFADEGESSETLDRPAMQELINAVQEGLIERVIVYKVDRLAKPLPMFAKLLAIFEEHEIKLVVVTDPILSATTMAATFHANEACKELHTLGLTELGARSVVLSGDTLDPPKGRT